MQNNKSVLSKFSGIRQVLFVAAAIAFSWLLFADSLDFQEAVAAGAAGITAAAAGYKLRLVTGHRQAGPAKWIRHMPGFIINGLNDCRILTVLLMRRIRGLPSKGSFRSVPFEYGSDSPGDTGRRILTVYGTTLQPNSYVAGFDRENDRILIHQLDPDRKITISKEIRRKE